MMPKFSKRTTVDKDGNFLYEAIWFWCPGCQDLHRMGIRTASGGKEPAWSMSGSGEELSFSPSILVTQRHPKGFTNENPAPKDYNGPYEEDRCHSYIRAGKIQFLGDCTHALKGQTVELPELPEWFLKEGEK